MGVPSVGGNKTDELAQPDSRRNGGMMARRGNNSDLYSSAGDDAAGTLPGASAIVSE
jgi:hypothetical protein